MQIIIFFPNEHCDLFLNFSSNYGDWKSSKNWILALFKFKNIYVAFWLKKAACKLLGARPRRRGRKNKVLYKAESPSGTHNQSIAQTQLSLLPDSWSRCSLLNSCDESSWCSAFVIAVSMRDRFHECYAWLWTVTHCRRVLNAHQLCSSVAWLLPFRHWSQYHSPLDNNAPRRAGPSSTDNLEMYLPSSLSGPATWPWPRQQGRCPRMLPRALQSPPSAPPT
jgi:hypothetical protein